MLKHIISRVFALLIITVISLEVIACTPKVTPFSPATTVASGLEKIKHFVFIMQENRSFDSYFGTYPGLTAYLPAYLLWTLMMVPLLLPYHDTNDSNLGGPHGWDNAQADIDNGKMDGFLTQSYKAKNQMETYSTLSSATVQIPRT